MSRALADEAIRIPEFGASDCDCPSYLVFDDGEVALVDAVERAHNRA